MPDASVERTIARLENPRRLEELPPRRLLEAAGLGPESYGRPLVIVDIGTGTGLYARALAGLLPNALIQACDVSPAMIAYLAGRLASEESSLRRRVRPIQSETRGLPLPDGSADLVLLVRVFHELEDPAALLAEARRVLKPGGALVAADWRKEPTPKGPPLGQRLDAAEALAVLAAAGFRGAAVFGSTGWDWIVSARKAAS